MGESGGVRPGNPSRTSKGDPKMSGQDPQVYPPPHKEGSQRGAVMAQYKACQRLQGPMADKGAAGRGMRWSIDHNTRQSGWSLKARGRGGIYKKAND